GLAERGAAAAVVDAVALLVGLAAVVAAGREVAGVADAVVVAVRLIRVRDERAVVDVVRNAVAVGVGTGDDRTGGLAGDARRTIGVGRADAVVADAGAALARRTRRRTVRRPRTRRAEALEAPAGGDEDRPGVAGRRDVGRRRIAAAERVVGRGR